MAVLERATTDRRIVYGDRTWQQFQLIRADIELLTRCILLGETSRLNAIKTFKAGL